VRGELCSGGGNWQGNNRGIVEGRSKIGGREADEDAKENIV